MPSAGSSIEPASGPALFDSPSKGADWAKRHGYDLMAQQLEDGMISAEEYEVSYTAHNSCLETAGWSFSATPAVWNPVDHLKLIRQGQGPSSPDLAAEKICNEQFDYVDYLFQTTTEAKMDVPLISAVEGCLDENGIPYFRGATNLPELVGADAGSSPSASTIADCVSSQTKLLYPELPAISIAF
jgi:hypothetical protein